ncbi:MAG: hypothetical protein RIQ89_1951, partial [Bacteroidota bacterium]
GGIVYTKIIKGGIYRYRKAMVS